MFVKIILFIAILLAILAVIISRQPDDFRYTRTATMAAKPAEVYAQVIDLQKWEAWSPWAKLDPTAKNTFEGAESGVGQIFRWDGNKNIGAGSLEIVESKPNEFIKINMEFLKPFKATNTAEFTFMPEGSNTQVSWTMYGKANFFSKAIGLVVDCEKMIGEQFDAGLSNIKAIVEAK